MARPASRDRLSRILAMVPWLEAQGPTPIAEVCERFDLTPAQLRADLNTVLVSGVYPHEPGDLADVFVDDDDDGDVEVSFSRFFEDGLRLTVDEALAVLVAGAGAASFVPDPGGALERAMSKVRASLGVGDPEDLEIVVPGEHEHFGTLQRGMDERRVVGIRYFSPNGNATTERSIEPLRTMLDDGATYVRAYCRASEGLRTFRLDRVLDATLTETPFEPRADPDDGDGVLQAVASVPRVTLELPPGSEWVLEAYPHQSSETLASGRIRVTLLVTARSWLERLWVRLGPEVRLIDGPDEWADAGPSAAGRMLATLATDDHR